MLYIPQSARYYRPIMETYRIAEGISVYYLTFSVVEWLPVFVQSDAFEIVTDSLRFCHVSKGLRINAYVIMPTHMHCILFDHEHNERRLEQTITAFRKFSGRRLAEFTAKHLPRCFDQCLWDADRSDRSRQFWQQSRHPEAITSLQFHQQKYDYIHNNPCRKGLVLYPEDWRFSSARYYQTNRDEDTDVPITQLDW